MTVGINHECFQQVLPFTGCHDEYCTVDAQGQQENNHCRVTSKAYGKEENVKL